MGPADVPFHISTVYCVTLFLHRSGIRYSVSYIDVANPHHEESHESIFIFTIVSLHNCRRFDGILVEICDACRFREERVFFLRRD